MRNDVLLDIATFLARRWSGKGRVVVPKGRFLTGSIVLKSGVELHLLKDAVLLGSLNPDDYSSLKRWKALVLSDHQSNISITGNGEIDGQGRKLALHIDSLFYAGRIDSDGKIVPRYQITMATGLDEETCRRVNLGYLDYRTFNYEAMRSDPNTLIVSDAGRDLYQV